MIMAMRAHIAEQCSLIAGTPVTPTDEETARWWAMLSRQEEVGVPCDHHGNFPPTASSLYREQALITPPLHADIRRMVAQCPSTMPRWPRGHRFAACLTHDVDYIVTLPWRERIRAMEALRGRIPARQWIRWAGAILAFAAGSAARLNQRAPFDTFLSEEERRGMRSTFFILPERLAAPSLFDHFYRYRDGIALRGHDLSLAEGLRCLHADGWEIGLQGSFHSIDVPGTLAVERAQVEEALGAPVTSVRQHYLHFSAVSTPMLHAEVGLEADSTLGYSTVIGCRAGLAFPYYWPSAPTLLEVPLVIHDVALLSPVARRVCLPDAIARARAVIAEIAEIGGLVSLSWHTYSDSPGAMACYRSLLDTIVEFNGWGCTLGAVAQWWRHRREQLRAMRVPWERGHAAC